jgi:hypothetical protein
MISAVPANLHFVRTRDYFRRSWLRRFFRPRPLHPTPTRYRRDASVIFFQRAADTTEWATP